MVPRAGLAATSVVSGLAMAAGEGRAEPRTR
jgi:hypothetical protein